MCAAIFPRSFGSFPRGYKRTARGAKKWGEVRTSRNERIEARFLHLAGLVPPIFAESQPSQAIRGTMHVQSGTAEALGNLPQPTPNGTASFILRSKYSSPVIHPHSPPSSRPACNMSWNKRGERRIVIFACGLISAIIAGGDGLTASFVPRSFSSPA